MRYPIAETVRRRPMAMAAAAAVSTASFLFLLGRPVTALALAGLVAGSLVAAILLRPRWALLLLVATEASNTSGVLGSRHGISAYVAVLLIATAALGLGVLSGRLSMRGSPVLLLMAVFIASQAASLLVARDSTAAWSSLILLVKDLWFLVVVVTLALTVTNAWTLARLLAGSMAVLAGLTVVNEFVLHNATSFGGYSVVSAATGVGTVTPRHAGPLPDPNFWGRLLLLAVPLAMALAADAWQRQVRGRAMAWGGSLLLLIAGIYLTQSRGALLGLLVVVMLWLALAGAQARRALLALPLLVVLLAAVPGVGSRLGSLAEVTRASSGEGDYSLVERTATQEISVAMFLDNPALGVGLGNIPARWEDYNTRADITVQRQVAPHNLYLQLVAETGLLGLTGWLVFFVGALVLCIRVLTICRTAPGPRAPPERLLAIGALAGLVGWGVASAFLHLTYLRPMLLVVAVIAVLDRQVRAQATTLPWSEERTERYTLLRGTGVLVFIGAVFAAGTFVTGVFKEQAWVARVPVMLHPTAAQGSAAGASEAAYAYDVLTRPLVLPTFAKVIEDAGSWRAGSAKELGADLRDYQPRVDGISTRAVVEVQVTGPERDRAELLARRIGDDGAAYVNRTALLSSLARASPSRLVEVWSETRWRLDHIAVVALAGLLGPLLRFFGWPRQARRRDS